MRYRSTELEVDAEQMSVDNALACLAVSGGRGLLKNGGMILRLRDGDHMVEEGDWIVRYDSGDLERVSADSFTARFEAIQ